nr:hypothetical protein GZ9D8_34 [uncultured archaeon GZfos9D8]
MTGDTACLSFTNLLLLLLSLLLVFVSLIILYHLLIFSSQEHPFHFAFFGGGRLTPRRNADVLSTLENYVEIGIYKTTTF